MSLPTEGLVTDAHGFVWEFHNGEDDHLALGGHEPGLIEMCRSLLPEGGMFYDIGAHVGLWTLHMATKGNVVAIEANPETYKVLDRNIERNRLRFSGGILAINYAAWDHSAKLGLIFADNKHTGGSTRVSETESERPVYGCPVDLMVELELIPGPPDLVKIDVEGGEAHVLRGMHRTIHEHRPVLFIEMHDMYWGPQIRTEVLNIHELMGYQWRDDIVFGGSYYILATYPDTVVPFPGEVVRAGDQ
jgi:FkbM family methyltransferase